MIEKGTKYFDGTTALDYCYCDGGRAAAGFKGSAGDCVTRAVSIALDLPYEYVYREMSTGNARTFKNGVRGKRSARNGIDSNAPWFRSWMFQRGWTWNPTMGIGTGCKVHLIKDELPSGRLIVRVSKHVCAVINGVIHDTFNPTWTTIHADGQGRAGGGYGRIAHRCVYGYWSLK